MEELENKIEEEFIQPIIKLDYKLKTCAERAELVTRIIEITPKEKLSNRYLEILGDYIMGAISKEEKKEHKYLTDNRLITINKRETSFEGLAEKFENGEDGIYQLMTNDKGIIFQPKQEITQDDINTIPGLKELRVEMDKVEQQGKIATGRKKYLLKKQLIEMRKDQYVLKSIFKPTLGFSQTSAKGINKIDLTEHRYIDEKGDPQSSGLISLFNPEHISALMQHYNALKLETKGRYWDDFYYLLDDFDNLLKRGLQNYPMYKDIVQMKMNNKTNIEIQQMLQKKYNVTHTAQYISSLWKNKIPKMLAEREQNDFLIWYYKTQEKGTWKRCSCCHEWKLASSRFFSKNRTSKDGFYSICKTCRNKK